MRGTGDTELGTILAIATLSVVGLTVTTPLLRRAIFAPLAALSLHLVLYTTNDYLTGCFTMINLFRMSDLLLLITDVQKELRRKGDALDVGRAPLFVRLKWALSLYASLRGVGWPHEPTSHLPPAPINDTKARFIVRQMLLIARAFFIINLGTLLCLLNPSFQQDGLPSSSQPLWLRPTTLGANFQFYGIFDGLYALCGIVGVALCLSVPKDWPTLFGPISGAYTVRNYWGRVWQQVLRKFITAYGTVFANALRIPKSRFRSYFSLYVAFFVSGIIHQFADFSTIQHWGGGSLVYFAMQAGAITFEDAVQGLMMRWGVGIPSALAKLVGYVWVVAWLSFTGPIMGEPHIRAGLTPGRELGNAFVRELARRIAPWLGH